MVLNVNLIRYLNNKGFTSREEMHEGFLGFGGYSFPKEVFNNQNPKVKFYLEFPNDNMVLEEQKVYVPEDIYRCISLIGTSNNGDFFDSITLNLNNNIKETKKIYFPDFLTNDPMEEEKVFYEFPYIHTKFGLVEYLKPKLWINTIKIHCKEKINMVSFPDNPSIHIFGIFLSYEEMNV